MWGAIKGIFSGGAFKSIENIASEWIETEKETAEAKTIMIKALDPNGLMRRNLSDRVAALYTLYLVVALLLLVCEFFGFVPSGGSPESVAIATEKVTELFMPITGLFGAIVTASFGVNYANVKQDK